MNNPGPGYRWNPPPNWPAAPHGWVMPKTWEPDAAWPPAPEGWVFWEPVALSPTRKATALLGTQWSGLARKTKVLTVIGSSIVALALLGTVVGSPPKTTASRPSVADRTPSPIASPEASPTDLPSPSPSAAAPAPVKTSPAAPVPPPAVNDDLRAFGATRTAWNANHIADTRLAPGCCYDETPGLAYPSEPKGDDRYAEVGEDGGRIDRYAVRFPPGSAKGDSTVFVLGEMPTDVVLVWSQVKDTCFQEEYRSATLTRVMGPATGVLMTFTSGVAGDHWDPRDVSGAFLLDNPPSAASSALGC